MTADDDPMRQFVRGRQDWTEEEDETLLRLVAAGAKIPEIAARLQRTKMGVTRRRQILKRRIKNADPSYQTKKKAAPEGGQRLGEDA